MFAFLNIGVWDVFVKFHGFMFFVLFVIRGFCHNDFIRGYFSSFS